MICLFNLLALVPYANHSCIDADRSGECHGAWVQHHCLVVCNGAFLSYRKHDYPSWAAIKSIRNAEVKHGNGFRTFYRHYDSGRGANGEVAKKSASLILNGPAGNRETFFVHALCCVFGVVLLFT